MLIEPRRFWRPCSQCCNSVKGFMVQHWSHESGRIVSDVPLFQTLSGSLRFLWSILMKYKGNLFMKSAVALLKHWRTHMSVALFIYIYIYIPQRLLLPILMLFSEHLTKGLTKPKFCFFLFFFHIIITRFSLWNGNTLSNLFRRGKKLLLFSFY